MFARTGIPPNIQQFLSTGKLVKCDNDVRKDSNLSLKIRLCGGSNSDICYSSGSLFICKECDQTLCSECNNRVHQHPKRAHHKPYDESKTVDQSIDSSNADSAFESLEEFEVALSQKSERSFSDAMLIASYPCRRVWSHFFQNIPERSN